MTKKIIGMITPKAEIKGEITASGKSAYEIWLDQGNQGTIADFLTAMDQHFEYDNPIPSKDWIIEHDLNKKHPSVTIIDSCERIVYGEVQYIEKNKIKVSFSAEFSGKAYLN